MERDRHSRQAASSNRHNTRAADPTASSHKGTTASSSSLPSHTFVTTPTKRSTSKRGRSSHAQDEQEGESGHSSVASELSRNKGKGKEISTPSAPIRRSSRHASQPSHSPTLVSKAAQAAAAASSTSHRSAGKRPAFDADSSFDQLPSKRSKPNQPATRPNPTSAASARMTHKRNSTHSSTSSSASSSHSQSKGKAKSSSSRPSRYTDHDSSRVKASSSSKNMDDHCGMNLDSAHEGGTGDDTHVDATAVVSETPTAPALTKQDSSSSLSKSASAKSSKPVKAPSELRNEGVVADADGMIHDDDVDDDEEDDGDDNYEDEHEDEYDDGNEGAFGMNIRAMAGYMTGLSGRFRSLLSSLRARHNPQAQLAALQELSDLLIVSTEDSLAGYFPIDSFVRELIYIMGGPKPIDHSSIRPSGSGGGSGGAGVGGSSMSLHDGDHSDSADFSVAVKKEEEEEDAAMAAAIAAAAGFEDNGEVMLIACRCLANLMEAMPYAAHSVVSCGAIPVLCSKLLEITFIDLAEQVLQTLEKISIDHPAAITKEGGLSAMLQFLDFFNIHVQRTAMTTAANCCRKLTADSFHMVREIMPIVQNVLTYADQRLVESACKCVVRIIDSYRHQPELLEQLITPELVGPLCELLLAASGGSDASTASVIIGSNIHTELLKALGTASKASPQVAVTLLDKNIVETLYQLLTGSASSRDISAIGTSASGSTSVPAVSIEDVTSDNAVSAAVAVIPDGSSVTVADMAVLQNLAQRPKEQIQDALSLIAELLPPLPRDGIFDPRAYTEKAHRRMLQKAKEKEREARRAARASRKATSASASAAGSSSKEKRAVVDADGDTEMAESSSGTDGPNGAVLSAMASSGDIAVSSAPEASSAAVSSDSAAEAASSSAAVLAAVPKTERTKSDREVAKEAANTKRIDKLKEHEAPVRRFSQLMLPTLVEVYAASVTLHVRTKALNAILKITSFMEAEDLRAILKDVPVANFIADILSSREHASLVHSALQMVELLFVKLPEVYQTVLRREGVMYEVDDIGSREPSGKGKAPEKAAEKSQTPSVKTEPVPVALPNRAPTGSSFSLERPSSSSSSGAATMSVRDPPPVFEHAVAGRGSYSTMINMAATEADDANIWRARILRDRFAAETLSGDGGKKAGQALDDIKKLVASLSDKTATDADKAREDVQKVAALFGKRDEPISSFELLKSGLIESLYNFCTSSDYKLDLQARRSIFMNAFLATGSSGSSPATFLVRRLQESLSRLENVEITTALSSGSDDTRRSPTAILAKQLRLRLVAEDSTDIPRTCHQVVVTIHAIASFQSLNDYLRPKIAASASGSANGSSSSGPGGEGNSRLSNILAALSAAGGGSEAGMSAASALRQSLAALGASVPAGSAAAIGGIPPLPRVTATTGSSNSEGSAGAGTGAGTDADKSTRRRSSRLGAGGADEADTTVGESASGGNEGDAGPSAEANGAGSSSLASALETDEALARRLVEGLLNEGYDEDMFSDEEYEEEVLEDELPPDTSTEQAEKAVALKVGSNGDVQAETSVATEPANDTAEASTSAAAAGTHGGAAASSSRSARSSYAAALQRKPSDWHLEFFMDGKPINLKSTIYGAVHKYESSRSTASTMSNRYIWQNIYTVTYKKVAGSSAAEGTKATPEPEDANSAAIELPESIPKDAPYATILQLLGVMHELNNVWREQDIRSAAEPHAEPALAESSFINNKLTAKLNRQLEEPMIVASSCLPGWCMDLPRVFPFLFPFEARYSYLQSTSFGYARLLTKWQNLHSRSQDSSSRRDDSFGFLSRLQRQKVRISRSRLFESALKVFELYGHNTSVLEVEYFEEVGTGLGPTLEFYALVSREFARRDLGIWRDDGNGSSTSKFVSAPNGLFPAPQSAAEVESEVGKQRLAVFKTLGQFVAKALLDSRIIDCNFSPVFMKAVLNAKIPTTLASLRAVDPALARSMSQLLGMDAAMLDAMALDFTLPGHPSIELVADGKSKTVTKDTLPEYVDGVISQTVHEGIQPAVRAFRRGFNLIMPLEALSSFTADELVMLFGNMEEDWSEATLLASIKPDHGFNSESASFRDLVAIMANFDSTKRREFLQWLTGSPKLPIGGFAGLHPQLTIVKRPHEAPLAPDDYLPSVMTCVNYLKMPGYSSREKMRRRLETAMAEGSGSFYLS